MNPKDTPYPNPIQSCWSHNKLPFGNIPRLLLAWVSTEAVADPKPRDGPVVFRVQPNPWFRVKVAQQIREELGEDLHDAMVVKLLLSVHKADGELSDKWSKRRSM